MDKVSEVEETGVLNVITRRHSNVITRRYDEVIP